MIIKFINAGAEEIFLLFEWKLISTVIYLNKIRLVIFKIPLYTI